MRKRRWLPEYKCEKLGMYIIEKVRWCNEDYPEKNCEGCPYNKGFKNDNDLVIDQQRKLEHKKALRQRRKNRNQD